MTAPLDRWNWCDIVTWLHWWDVGITRWSALDVSCARRVLDAVDATAAGRIDPATVLSDVPVVVHRQAVAALYLLAQLLSLSTDRHRLASELVLRAADERGLWLAGELTALANALIDEAIIHACKLDVPVESSPLGRRVDGFDASVAECLMTLIKVLAALRVECPAHFAEVRKVFANVGAA